MHKLRFIAVFMLLFFIAQNGRAGDRMHSRLFHYGVEWGIGAFMLTADKYTYFAEEGYLVDYRGTSSIFHTNGIADVYIGAEMNHWLELSLRTGYMGIGKGERGVPVNLRGTIILSEKSLCRSGGIFMEPGVLFSSGQKPAYTCRLGYLYRFSLTCGMALEFGCGIVSAYSHPNVRDRLSGEYVKKENVGMTRSLKAGLMITTAIVF